MIMHKHLRLTGNSGSVRHSTLRLDDDCQGRAVLAQWTRAPRTERLELVQQPSPILHQEGPFETGTTRSHWSIGERAEGRAARRVAARKVRREGGTQCNRSEIALHREAGMATAEYAIATLAAVGFAAILVAVLSSGQIKGLLTSLITTALNFG